jgi:beta-xylosidase
LVRGILNAMNVAKIRKLAGLISLLAGVAALPGRATPAAVPEDTAQNPVLWADVPDLSMIRVGNTYYMSSTTMHLSPGVPIMKSRDLVNWQLVNYAYDTLGDLDELALRNGKNDYGRGSWASSLRYHNGEYFVTTFCSVTRKTYVFKTKNIEKGPWTHASFEPALHDHSLFFDDDGRVYMATGSGSIKLIELTSDATGIKPDGVNQVIIPNATLVAGPNVGLPAEGSQLFKISGKYYLFSITWPRGGMRTELVFRADKITGPYEGRVALRDQGVAQGGLIDTPEGKWYAYLFQDHGAVGRTPFLVPVKWEDGWPTLGTDGKAPLTLDLPAVKGNIPGIVASDEFDRPASLRKELKRAERGGNDYVRSAFPLAWQWNHNPDNRFWSLTDRPGWLRLTTGRVDATLVDAGNTLTQRMFGPQCSGSVSLDVSRMKEGDVAGLAAFQKNYGFVGVKVTGNSRSIVMVGAESGRPVELVSVPLDQNSVFLKLEADFENRTDRAHFYYSLDGKTWNPIGAPLKMTYTLPHFMGYRFALFNFATKAPGGSVDFDYFRVTTEL